MKNIFISIIALLSLSSCSQAIYESGTNSDSKALYDEFWNHVHKNYIYFNEKNVDWDEVYAKYGSTITDMTTEGELFEAMEASLLELKDSHINLGSTFGIAKRYDFRDGYEIHFSLENIENKYTTSGLKKSSIFSYGHINETTPYIYVPKMAHVQHLRALMRELTTDKTASIILDLRNNGGGDSNPVHQLLGDYVTEKTYLGGYIEKSGPSIDDKTEPLGVYAEPNSDYHFDGKVFLLINRGGYSATSYMAAMVKAIPNYTVVGQVTGGGGGGTAGFELSNGWLMSVSVSDFVDIEGNSIESGVEPDVKVVNSKEDIEEGRDPMLEAALSLR